MMRRKNNHNEKKIGSNTKEKKIKKKIQQTMCNICRCRFSSSIERALFKVHKKRHDH